MQQTQQAQQQAAGADRGGLGLPVGDGHVERRRIRPAGGRTSTGLSRDCSGPLGDSLFDMQDRAASGRSHRVDVSQDERDGDVRRARRGQRRRLRDLHGALVSMEAETRKSVRSGGRGSQQRPSVEFVRYSKKVRLPVRSTRTGGKRQVQERDRRGQAPEGARRRQADQDIRRPHQAEGGDALSRDYCPG